METLSISLFPYFSPKPPTTKSTPNSIFSNQIPIFNPNKNHAQFPKIIPTQFPNHAQNLKSTLKIQSLLHFPLFFPLPTFAAENGLTVPDKINIESILISIDDFITRYPFFVSGVAFVWLLVIPLTEEYLRKYKYISAISAFKKLKEDPNAQLLDIRDKKSLEVMRSPNLRIFNKGVVQVEFVDGDEDGFVKRVRDSFHDPGNTSLCILDNFDGESMKVAELLFKNGFKEAYAIRGGVRGKKGWQAIQETLLPPSVHIYPRKKVKKSQPVQHNGAINLQSEVNNQPSSLERKGQTNYEHISSSVDLSKTIKNNSRPLSPYPKYPDLKPPASPTPSKPQN